ncbi:MAG: tetratricopeptide repeat protein [Acidobacteriota bacterium]
MSVSASRHVLVSSVWLMALTIVATACGKTSRQSKEQFLESGNKYVGQQKYAEAIVEYRNALKIDNKFGPAHQRLAEAYLKTNALPNALRELVVAADLLPSDAAAQLEAGQILLIAKRFEDARARAEKVVALDPKNVEAQILKGNAAAGLRNLTTAIDDINEAIRIDPNNARAYANLGAIEMQSGRAAEAEAAFKRAVEVDSTSVVAQLALANFYWSAGRTAETEAPLKRAVELDPLSAIGQRALSTFYVSTNRPQEAEAPLKILAQQPGDLQARLTLADYYARSQRADEAIALLQTVAKEHSGYADATLRLAAIDYIQKREAEAHRRVDEVRSKQPKNTQAAIMKARFLVTEGKVDEALALTQAAVASDPKSASAQYLLGTLLAIRNEFDEAIGAFNEVGRLNPRVGGVQVRIAELNLRKGATATAVQFAEQAVRDAPKSLDARMVLARALAGAGDLRRAETIMQGLLTERPDLAPFHEQMGNILLVKKDTAGARREFDQALKIDPKAIGALRGRLSLDIGSNNVAGARTTIEAMVQKSPNNTDLLLLEAGVYGAARDVVREEQVLRRIIEIDPSHFQAFSSLAALFVRAGRLEEAKTEYESLSKRQPKSIAAPTMVALILEAQKKPAEAQKVYEKIVATSPAAAVAANNLAWLYAEGSGNLDVAMQLAVSASQQLPKVPEVTDTLGWIYVKKGLAELAIPPLLASVEGDPKNASYRYHLGLAYVKKGDKRKAKDAFDEALKLQPGLKEAADARAALLAS